MKTDVQRKKVRISEFMVYSDLVVQKGDTRIQELGIEDYTIYSNAPSCCTMCDYKEIVAVHVLGASDGTLFWMCDDCGALFLKINQDKTEMLLEKSSHLWTNHEDWGVPENGELN